MARFFLLPLLAIAFAAPAAAQPAPEPPESDILVTGNRDVEAQIDSFVGALTPSSPRGQLSRFEQPICPVAIGLPDSQRDAVVERMRRIAEAAGIAVGGRRCTPNVLLVVTQDKRAFLEGLLRRHGYYFGELPMRRVRELIAATGPAVAWHVDGPPVSARGRTLRSEGSSEVFVNRTTSPPSRITAGARPQFAAAMVVVESGALDGLSTTQLADYAAMRAFARTEPERLGATPAPTILNVLEAPMGSEVPLTMTRWDLGFLRGLYGGAENLYAASERSAIRRSIESELAAPEGRQQ
jgi:hypothetical protein